MEIYTLKNGQADKLLYVFSNQCLLEFSDAIEHFGRLTGIKIDLYGDTKFSAGTEGLIRSISEALAPDSKVKADVIEVLTNNQNVMFVGD